MDKILSQLKKGTLGEKETTELLKIFRIRERRPSDWKYEDLHIRLPRGIFNKPIEQALKRNLPPTGKHTSINPSFAIAHLFPEIQPFYTYTRNYAYRDCAYAGDAKLALKEITKDIVRFKKLQNPTESQETQLTEHEDFYNIVEKTEKEIRHYQTCDRILWQMLKFYFKNKGENENDITKWSLVKVGADLAEKENCLDSETPMEHRIYDKTIYDKASIKRYGEFRRILKDRRLQNLFTWYQKEKISKLELQGELDAYDRKRNSLMKLIFDFEKSMGEKLTDGEKVDLLKRQQKQNGLTILDHRSYLIGFSERAVLEVPVEHITELRNCICHNDYPQATLFNEYVEDGFKTKNADEGTLYSILLTDYITRIYENDLAISF